MQQNKNKGTGKKKRSLIKELRRENAYLKGQKALLMRIRAQKNDEICLLESRETKLNAVIASLLQHLDGKVVITLDELNENIGRVVDARMTERGIEICINASIEGMAAERHEAGTQMPSKTTEK